MLERITHEEFTPLVHDRFRIELDALSVDLELDSVDLPRISVEGGQRQPFSLVFSGDAEALLPQRLYPLQHDGLGSLEMFLVPIGPRPDGRMRYEAVFS